MLRRLAASFLAAASLCVTLATCSDLPTAAKHRSGSVALVPQFTPQALAAAKQLASFSLTVNNVRIVLVRPVLPPDTVIDTTVVVTPADTVLDLTFTVPRVHAGESLAAALQFRDGSTVLFSGAASVVAVAAGSHPTAATIPTIFVGPGASATALAIAPRDTMLVRDATLQFRFAATNAAGDTVTDAEVAWELTGADAGETIDASGLLHAGSGSDTLRVVAHTLGGLRDSTSVTIIAPARLVLTTPPSDSAKDGQPLGTQPVVQVQDAGGTPVHLAGLTVNAALAGSGATLSGTSSIQTDANGVATFTDLVLTGTAGPRKLRFSSGTLQKDSARVSLVAGNPASLSLNDGDGQSAAVGTNVATAPSVKVVDADGNAVSGVSVAFSVSGSAGGSVTGANPSTNSSGVARVSSWQMGHVVGTDTLTATVSGLSGSPVTFQATATAGAAASIAAHAGNGQSATAGSAVATPPQVLVTDAFGNPVSGTAVTFAVASGGGSVTGGSATTDASGLASVGSWTLGATAGNNTLTAASTGLSGSPVTFSATGVVGAASVVAINAGDAQTAKVGTAVSTPPSVIVTDAHSNPVSGVSVTFAVASGGGSVTGATATTNASGVAAVGSWTMGALVGANTLTATSAGLSGSPVTFTATAVAANANSIVVNAGNGQSATVATAVATLPSVLVTDANSNPVSGVSVTFAVASGGGSITGATATTNASGVATVGSWTLGATAGANTMTASSSGLAGSPVTFTATATAGAAVSIALHTGDGQSATVGTTVTAPSVLVTDAHANPVSAVSVTFAIASGGGSITGGSATTNSSGVATVGSWTLGATAGTNTLKATSPGLTGSPIIFTATGTAGAATNIAIHGGDGQSVPAGTAVPTAPSVLVTDANANPVSGVSVMFAVASGGGSVTGGSATTNSGGIATVGSWTLGATAGSNTLTATSTGLTGSPLTFSATGTPGTAATIAIDVGNGQSATVHTAVSTAPRVLVKDANGNPVSGVTVTFAVPTGGSTITGASPTTNASGLAAVGSWTVDTLAGPDSLQATVTGAGTVTFTATATAGSWSKLVFVTAPSLQPKDREVFPTQPVVQTADAYGNPVDSAGYLINVGITAGPAGAVLDTTLSATTDANGQAAFSTLTLGGKVGTYTLTFHDSDFLISSLSQAIVLQSGSAVHVYAISGLDQLAVAGTSIPVAPAFHVTDADSNAVSGETFTVTASTGSTLSDGPETLTSGADGSATVTGTWTLGATGGSNSDYLQAKLSTCVPNSDGCFPPTANALATGLWSVSAVAAGGNHACATAASDGTLSCWGSNELWQLTQGPSTGLTGGTVGANYARAQQALTSAPASFALGGDHTCYTDTNNQYCAGDDTYGQVGDDGSAGYVSAFAQSYLDINAGSPLQTATGAIHTCTLTADFTIQCTGDNTYGQLGDSTNNQTANPVYVAGGHSWISVSAGGNTTCAIEQTTQHGYCWGQNQFGQLGSGDSASTTGPILIAGGHQWSELATAGDHTCGITTGGAVMCWGANGVGQLGIGDNSANHPTPTTVSSGSYTLTQLSLGTALSCAIDATSKRAYCWGDNGSGQMGIGTSGSYSPAPGPASLPAGASHVAASKTGTFVCAIDADSTLHGLWCWGNNDHGQLGIGSVGGYAQMPLAVQTYVPAP